MMSADAAISGKRKRMTPSIFISAGEASGEYYGALLIEALKRQLAARGQHATFFGMGGKRMETAGLERIVHAEDMAVMGLTEVVHHLPRIYGEYKKLKQAIRKRRPSVAVLIDFPGLHFKLAAELHKLGIPVVYFVSPQLWAWKKGRIRKVRKFVSRMLVIFPFEEDFYRNHDVKAEFVGHPLAEAPPPSISREQFARENGLDPEKTWIGLLPGSRPKEIREILPVLLETARGISKRHSDFNSRNIPDAASDSENSGQELRRRRWDMVKTDGIEFVIPLAPTLNAAQRDEVRRMVENGGSGLPVHSVENARATLLYARTSVVASGTATVEAALIGNPFVVVYRVSPLTYAMAKWLVKVPYVAMANLIAGKLVVPELIQSDFTAENIILEVERLLPDGTPRQSMMYELERIRVLLGGGKSGDAINRVAEATLQLMSAG
jgi:lipid-A-disaccharide synthase